MKDGDVLKDVVAGGVAARNGERIGGDVGREDVEIRQFASQRDGDGAAARADVRGATAFASDRAQVTHGPFDGNLGLRARHEHARIDREHAAVESGLAGHVGEGHAALALCDERFEALGNVGR